MMDRARAKAVPGCKPRIFATGNQGRPQKNSCTQIKRRTSLLETNSPYFCLRNPVRVQIFRDEHKSNAARAAVEHLPNGRVLHGNKDDLRRWIHAAKALSRLVWQSMRLPTRWNTRPLHIRADELNDFIHRRARLENRRHAGLLQPFDILIWNDPAHQHDHIVHLVLLE
jgi:hypothetical protein